MDPGTPLPDVMLTGAEGPVALKAISGPVVIYFYPKDDTPGCTREAQDFTALAPAFAAAGVRVIGVSRDSLARHARFTAKHALGIELASDDGTASEAFGVWVEKKLYGRVHMGIERATFLFAADGRLAHAWREVKVPGHAEAVLAAAREL